MVKFEPEKLKVLRTSTVPKRRRDLMRPTEAAFLADVSQIELGAEEVESVRELQSLPRPFWDASLRRDPALLKKFVKQLFDRKMIGFRTALKARAGLFFVKKKPGADGKEQIRMIVDCRQANYFHKLPPRTRLGSTAALSEVDLSTESLIHAGVGDLAAIDVRTSTADVDDAFYQIGVPEVASWFGIDLGMKGSEVLSWGCSSAWSDLEKRQLDIDPCVTYYPVIEVMPMGWSWALHFVTSWCGILQSLGLACPTWRWWRSGRLRLS